MTVSLLVLVGWSIDSETLKAVIPGLVSMKANTALALLISGAVLLLVNAGRENRRTRISAQIGAGFISLVGLLTLIEYVLGADLGIDQILFKEAPGAPGTLLAPGRMAPPTALCFLLLGLAFLAINTETGRHRRPSQWLAEVVGLIGLLAMLGYIHGIGALSQVGLTKYTQMALNTSFTFIVLSLGVVFARPDRGQMAVVSARSQAGFLARRFLGVSLVLILVLDVLISAGARAGFFSHDLELALFVALFVPILAAAILSATAALDRAETRRREAEVDNARLASVVEAMPDFVAVADMRGRFVHLNSTARSVLGVGEEGKAGSLALHDAFAEKTTARIMDEGLPGAVKDGFWIGRGHMGAEPGAPVSLLVMVHKDAEGLPSLFSVIAGDMAGVEVDSEAA